MPVCLLGLIWRCFCLRVTINESKFSDHGFAIHSGLETLLMKGSFSLLFPSFYGNAVVVRNGDCPLFKINCMRCKVSISGGAE